MRADRGPENGMGLFFYNFGGDQLHRFTRLYLQRLQKQLPPDVAFPCNVTDNKLSNTTLESFKSFSVIYCLPHELISDTRGRTPFSWV
nr:PREDICTED: uncharacterized protein LOC100877339 isoform X4 [Megachile rotundata]